MGDEKPLVQPDDAEAREAFNEIAWRDFVLYAWSQDGAHAAFRGATGRPQRPRRGSPIDALIDKACGVVEDDAYMTEFVDWVTANHWGTESAPKSWRAKGRASIQGRG